MTLVTRQGKGSRLTIQEMDNNLLYLQGLGYSENPIIQAYLIAKYNVGYLNTEDLLFPRGVFVPYQEGMILPDNGIYSIGSVETHLVILDYFYNQPYADFVKRLFKINTINKSSASSVETYYHYRGYISERQWEIDKLQFNSDFINQFQEFKTYDSPLYGNMEYFDRIIDKGIVEMGSMGEKSQIENLIKLATELSWYYPAAENFDRMLDLGIVVLDLKKFPMLSWNQGTQIAKNGLLVMNREQFLTYLDSFLAPAVLA